MRRLEGRVRVLRRDGPTLSGQSVAGLDGVPAHLRRPPLAQSRCGPSCVGTLPRAGSVQLQPQASLKFRLLDSGSEKV